MTKEIETENKKGRKNLIFATLISIPGPLLLIFGMLEGANSTQIADLIKRSCEFLTIALAWLVYELTLHNSIHSAAKLRLEAFIKYFTGLSMCLSGGIMLYVAVADFGGNTGDMIPSMILAIIGAIINTKLYLNYRSMSHAVLSIQAKLHRVKALLDGGLVLILLVWFLASNETVKLYSNVIGTACISLYLIWSGFGVLDIKGRRSKNA